MAFLSKTRTTSALLIGLFSWPMLLTAQSTQPTDTTNSATAYGQLFLTLGTQYAIHASVRDDLIRQRDEIQRALIDSATDLQRVAATELVLQMKEFEREILGLLSAEAGLYSTTSSSSGSSSSGSLPRSGRSHSRLSASQTEAARTAASYKHQFQLMSEQNRWLQLDAAARLILERHQKLLLSADALTQKSNVWMVGDRQLLNQYLDLADITRTRSQPELAAAVSALETTSPENMGARLSLAISLMRLGKHNEAQKCLNQLLSKPTLARPLGMAVRGELAARSQDLVTAKKALSEAIRLAPQDPFVRMIHAQTMSLLGDAKTATTDWELLIKSGKHDIAAHRGLALVYCQFGRDKPRSQKLAKEHAELAASLAGETDWSSQVTLALATAIAGDGETAVALAEKASNCAQADKRELCQEIARQLKAGVIPKWQF